MAHPQFTPSDLARFWSKVDSSGGIDACWPWRKRGRDRDGYGLFYVYDGVKSYTLRAHRVALEITGRLRRQALHSCDNPPCCNPWHLWDGTGQENRDDSVKKGRHAHGDNHPSHRHPWTRPRGESHGLAKLTASDIPIIRALIKDRVALSAIAARFTVSKSTIHAVGTRKTWGHV